MIGIALICIGIFAQDFEIGIAMLFFFAGIFIIIFTNYEN